LTTHIVLQIRQTLLERIVLNDEFFDFLCSDSLFQLELKIRLLNMQHSQIDKQIYLTSDYSHFLNEMSFLSFTSSHLRLIFADLAKIKHEHGLAFR
jgi:hypothetical protein